MNNEFAILLRLHRQSMTEQEKQKEVRPPAWLYPLATEKSYTKALSRIMTTYINSLMAKLELHLERWIIQSRRDIHSDAWEDSYREFLDDTEKLIALYFGTGLLFDTELGELVQTTADKIVEQSIKQWGKQTRAVMGDAYYGLPPDWVAIKRLWTEENYRALRDLALEYNKKLNMTLVTGLSAGWLYDAFAEQMEQLNHKMSKYRVALIGRGQTGILVSQIAQNYALSISNDEYVWQTSLDERVRGNPLGIYPKAIPSHWAMEGMICKWGDSSVYSLDGKVWKKRTANMPLLPVGMDWGCRCTPGVYWGNYIRDYGL